MGTCVLCQDSFGGARGVVQLRNCECVCLFARLYVRTFGRLDVFMSGRLYVCTFVFVYTSGCLDILHLSTFARVLVCTSARLHGLTCCTSGRLHVWTCGRLDVAVLMHSTQV